MNKLGEVMGFGYVPQKVMTMPALNRKAKLIYGFFAVYADSKTWQTKQQESYICSMLKMTPKTFRKYRDELVNLGLITTQKHSRGIIYRLNANAPISDNNKQNIAFGYLPKSIMVDRELSNDAKVIYMLLASFSNENGEAFPTVQRIMDSLGMNQHIFYRARKELIATGLLIVKIRYDGKKNQSNIYTLIPNKELFNTYMQTLKDAPPLEKVAYDLEINKSEKDKELLANINYQPMDTSELNEDFTTYYAKIYERPLTIQQTEMIQKFVSLYGNEWVNLAFYQANRKGKPFEYAYTICINWNLKGLTTINQIKWDTREHYREMGKEEL